MIPPTNLPVTIAGLGAYLPPRRVTSAALETELGLQPGWIERRTGGAEHHLHAVKRKLAHGVAGSAAA